MKIGQYITIPSFIYPLSPLSVKIFLLIPRLHQYDLPERKRDRHLILREFIAHAEAVIRPEEMILKRVLRPGDGQRVHRELHRKQGKILPERFLPF